MRLLSSVGQHVIPQITSPTTWFVATHTLVQLLSTVGKHVIFQITSQTEWFASRQFLQSSSITELFVASVTFVWLLSSVDEHVSSQISSLIEWFVANGTLMWLFSNVCHGVFPQNFSSIEWCVALFTNVQLSPIWMIMCVPHCTFSLHCESTSAVSEFQHDQMIWNNAYKNVVNCPTRWSLYYPLGFCIDHLYFKTQISNEI